MAILQFTNNVTGLTGVLPKLSFLVSDDTYAVVTSVGYLNNLHHQGYDIGPTDCILTLYSSTAHPVFTPKFDIFVPAIDGLRNITLFPTFAASGTVPAINVGTLAARPAPGNPNTIYVTTDTLAIFLDDGASWDQLSTLAFDLATTGSAVNVSAAAPPVVGQVLKATSATTATWQADSGSLLTTKGDLLSHDGTTEVRVPVGADGTVFNADSTQASGNGWVSILKDATLLSSVDFQNRALYDNAGTNVVVDWDGQQLIDTAGFGAMLWSSGNRQLSDDAGNLVMNFTAASRKLYATDGATIMFDWGIPNHALVGPSGNARMDFTGGGAATTIVGVNSSAADSSMTFETKGTGSYAFTSGTTGLLGLINQAGAVNGWNMSASTTGNPVLIESVGSDTDVSMELVAQGAGDVISSSRLMANKGLIANDFSSGISIDSTARELSNSSGDVTLSWEGQTLSDNAGSPVLDWNQRQQYSPLGVVSIDWLNRFLIAPDGTTRVVDWTGPYLEVLGLQIPEGGAGSKQGVATLVAGTVTVANSSITANSRIFLTAQDNNSVGSLRVSARTVGTNFTITSSVNTDNGIVAFEIFEPA